MAGQPEITNMALFCDFENIAIGVCDAKYAQFDIGKVLERLLLKGSIVVKKAYCDWDRYKDFKAGMHQASFELIEIPHVRISGKNSADIRMVVDALDLCYTKSHVDTFVIISGDSDFSPLVSKLRENAKTVIGVGVKNSTADLFINNCDEFLYYDDLVRAAPRPRRRSAAHPAAAPAKTSDGEAKAPEGEAKPAESEGKVPPGPAVTDGFDLVMKTLEAISAERGADDLTYGSMIKQAIKRRHPGFNERAYGFRSFNDMLLEMQKRNMLKLDPDKKSGGYTVIAVE